MHNIINFLLIFLFLNSCSSNAKQEYTSDHYDPNSETFFNPGLQHQKGFLDVLNWLWNRKNTNWPEKVDLKATANIALNLKENEISITYINHSTYLIQLPEINILTDPVWSERVSPFSFIGPKRVIDPGLAFEKLPKIDFVIISHNHYDHMDIETLKKINAVHSPGFIVPLKNKEYLIEQGLQNVYELDWWESMTSEKELKISVVPAQHFSSRSLFDRNKTLWGGFVVEYKSFSFYFAGDTGHSVHFKSISEKFKNLDFSFLPIGAYEPRWFMKDMHINPEEAVTAHQILNSKISFGMHFGCFKLSDEEFNQPVIDLEASIKENNINKSHMRVLDVGQSVYFRKINNLLQEFKNE